MTDILHKIGIKSPSPAAVYAALTTTRGLAGWWTSTTGGEPGVVGGVIEFRFGGGGFDMKTTELRSNAVVAWRVVGGPAEWLDTQIRFDIRQEGEWTIVFFTHQGWKEPSEFLRHCSTKWAIFLLSLKSLIESGAGGPWPREVKIDAWE